MSDCHDRPCICEECDFWFICEGGCLEDCLADLAEDGSRDAYE